MPLWLQLLIGMGAGIGFGLILGHLVTRLRK